MDMKTGNTVLNPIWALFPLSFQFQIHSPACRQFRPDSRQSSRGPVLLSSHLRRQFVLCPVRRYGITIPGIIINPACRHALDQSYASSPQENRTYFPEIRNFIPSASISFARSCMHSLGRFFITPILWDFLFLRMLQNPSLSTENEWLPSWLAFFFRCRIFPRPSL